MKRIILILTVTCTVLLLSFQLQANSAIQIWHGSDAHDVIASDEDCPLTVLHEDLLFDLPDTPNSWTEDKDRFLQYRNTVTAEYTFHNPSDMHVHAQLAFPFGSYPMYFYGTFNNDFGDILKQEQAKYTVQINGQAAPVTLRHTWLYGRAYDTEKDLPLLDESFRDDSFLHKDTPVTIFTYAIEGIDVQSAAAVRTVLDQDPSHERWLFSPYNGGEIRDDKTVVQVWAAGGPITCICFGNAEPKEPEWTFVKNGESEEEIEGTITLQQKETLSFYDFAMRQYDEDSGMLDHDWYNIYVGFLNASREGPRLYTAKIHEGPDPERILRWYVYTIDLDPGETLVNTVQAPIYPSIDMSYKDPVYSYLYLLSPASTWKEFGTLDVRIQSPQFLLNSVPENVFRIQDDTKAAAFETLPEGELQFDLCTVEKPEKIRNASSYLYLLVFLLPIIGGVILFFVLLALILRFLFRKRA